ncbi:hypothetical protein HRbin01_01022 [archaeon HR01]|nr:hypothetical protein HRbin01_01022 [archaeon HR01]
MAEEYFEWQLLPHDLKASFFHEADKESRFLAERIQQLSEHLEKAVPIIKPHLQRLKTHNRLHTVSAVDGSRSPKLSERLGARYGVYSVGSVTVYGLERRDEILKGSVFKRRQALSRDVSKHLFDLLMTNAERKLALEMLGKADLVVIDGSFLGFLTKSLRIKSEEISEEIARTLDETVGITRDLMDSGNVISVVKRSPSKAIGGHLVLRDGLETPFKYILDRFILSFIMEPGSVFYYEDLLGEAHPISYYNAVAAHAQRLTSLEDVEMRARRDIYAPIQRFRYEGGEELLRRLTRVQVRVSASAPTCEIEYPRNISRARLEEWLGQPHFFSHGTGLPVALDLVDSLVGIPSRFTDEFVAELEARTLDRLGGRDFEVLKLFFAYLNPQKPI